MYLKCPVLARNSPSVPEVCGDAPFYFELNSPESLHDTLVRVVQNDYARARAIERGQVVASRYSWEKCAVQTLAV